MPLELHFWNITHQSHLGNLKMQIPMPSPRIFPWDGARRLRLSKLGSAWEGLMGKEAVLWLFVSAMFSQEPTSSCLPQSQADDHS